MVCICRVNYDPEICRCNKSCMHSVTLMGSLVLSNAGAAQPLLSELPYIGFSVLWQGLECGQGLFPLTETPTPKRLISATGISFSHFLTQHLIICSILKIKSRNGSSNDPQIKQWVVYTSLHLHLLRSLRSRNNPCCPILGRRNCASSLFNLISGFGRKKFCELAVGCFIVTHTCLSKLHNLHFLSL